MTDQPLPPPRNTSPPPPPPGGYPPPPPARGSGYPPQASAQALPKEAYTPWFTRAVGSVIDSIAPILLALIGGAYFNSRAFKDSTVCIYQELGEFCVTGNTGVPTEALAVLLVTALVATAFVIWNNGYRQGTTGSSIGKLITKFQVVSEKNGLPIGFGKSIVRQLAHLIDSAICFIGYLFPLWDAKRQTIADKLIATVCVPLNPQPLPPGPHSGDTSVAP
jgi:RDD family